MSAQALQWADVPPTDDDDTPGPNKEVALWARLVYEDARKRAGGRLSKEDFAAQIGVSRNGLSKVLNGHSGMDVATRRKLTRAAPLELRGGPEAIVLGANASVERPTQQAYVRPPTSGAGGYVESSQSRIVGHALDTIDDESVRTEAMIKALAGIKEALSEAAKRPTSLGADIRPDRSQHE